MTLEQLVEGLVNRLAVECDGEAWHGPERFEQDMARQRQLERAGWTFVRIRESEFYADRDSVVQRIVEACEELGIRPIGEEERGLDESQEISRAVGEAFSEEHAEEEELDESGKAEEEDAGKTRGDRGPTALAEYSQELVFPDPREASVVNIRAALRQIIEREGPLTKRLLIKLYVAGCPALFRAGKTVRSLLNRALYSMQRAGEIVVEDELGDGTPESQVLRLAGAPRVRERPAGGRDLLEIPPSELFLVLDRLLGSSYDRLHDEESLFRALLEHYGFSRLTEARRRYLARILKRYRQLRTSLESGT